MNVQPSPTSPKARLRSKAEEISSLYTEKGAQPFQRPTERKGFSYRTFILSVSLALVSGVLGGMLYNVYVSEWVGEPQDTVTPLGRVRASSSIFSAAETRKSILMIAAAHAEDDPNTVYAAREQRGSALLLSRDGWGVTTSDVLADGPTVAITYDQQIFLVEDRVVDPATDLVFFRIGGNGHDVTSLKTTDLVSGETLYSVAAGTSVGTSSVAEVVVDQVRQSRDEEQAIESSDAFGRVVGLRGSVPKGFLGAPVLDEDGAVVGLVRDESDRPSFWPASVVSGVISTLLSESTVIRSSLGLSYVDLALTPGIPEAKRLNRLQGAYISEKETLLANKGIQIGDIIVAVGEQTLNASMGFHEALQSVSPESVVSITLIRDGVEQKIPLTPDATVATAIR